MPTAKVGGHVVLALPLLKRDQGNAMAFSEALYRSDKCRGHRFEQHGGCKPMSKVKAQIVRDPFGRLQSRHVEIQIHPVDSLDFQNHMLLQDLRHALCYRHGDSVWLPRPSLRKRHHRHVRNITALRLRRSTNDQPSGVTSPLTRFHLRPTRSPVYANRPINHEPLWNMSCRSEVKPR